MKVRMSYDIDVKKIPYELKKNKQEIAELLAKITKKIEDVEIVDDIKQINVGRIAVEGCAEDLNQVHDKLESLLDYLKSYADVTQRLKDEELKMKASEMIEEQAAAVKEQAQALIDERTREFNSLIKVREDTIKELEKRVLDAENSLKAQAPQPKAKKKSTRKKKDV
jgi:hypothetical protein